jgi:hypothetical protein
MSLGLEKSKNRSNIGLEKLEKDLIIGLEKCYFCS